MFDSLNMLSERVREGVHECLAHLTSDVNELGKEYMNV